jgi:hypothetical protein
MAYRHQIDMASTQQGTAASQQPSPHRTGDFGISGLRGVVPSRHRSTPPASHPASTSMRTAAAIEDSRADASPAHRGIGSSRQWFFRRPHNAASIAPFLLIEISWQFCHSAGLPRQNATRRTMRDSPEGKAAIRRRENRRRFGRFI